MRSSISDSKSTALTYAQALAGICALLIITLEIFSGYLLRHHSVTYVRISRQYDEAVKVRPAGPCEPPSVLMVCNSLLLHVSKMNPYLALPSPPFGLHPFFLELPGYYNWLCVLPPSCP